MARTAKTNRSRRYRRGIQRDQRAEHQQGGQLEQLGDVLPEVLESRPLPRPERRHGDPGRERGQEQVYMGCLRHAQHQQADREAVERLVRRRRGEEPAAFQHDGRDRDHHADDDAERHLHGELAQMQVRRACRDGEKHDDERQRQAVVDTGLDVEQVPQPCRDLVVADQRGGEHRVGRRQDGPDQQRLRPPQPGDEVGSHRCHQQGQRQTSTQGTAGQSPRRAQVRPTDPHAVSEQHREQRQLRERPDDG
jgi:hypothetical protein